MVNQQLVEWIKNQKSQGYSPRQIYNTLVQQGYNPQEVSQALNFARNYRQKASASPILESQNWIIFVLLCILSLGIYFPIWYNAIRKKSLEINSENRISKGLVVLLFITSILEVFFLLVLIIIPKLNLLDSLLILSILVLIISNILMGLFGTIGGILILILAFQTRKIISTVYSINKPSGLATFFFNILYLQIKINNLNKNTQTQSIKSNQSNLKILFVFLILFSFLTVFAVLPMNTDVNEIISKGDSQIGNQTSYRVMILFDIPSEFLDGETGIIAGGEVLSGTLHKGMKTIINDKESKINFIEINYEYVESVNQGDRPAIGLTNLASKDELKTGTILYFTD